MLQRFGNLLINPEEVVAISIGKDEDGEPAATIVLCHMGDVVEIGANADDAMQLMSWSIQD